MNDHAAAELAQTALAAVLGPEIVSGLRCDSPLSGVGVRAGDWICLCDVVETAAREQGVACVLDDDDVSRVVTVADLIDVITARATPALAPRRDQQ